MKLNPMEEREVCGVWAWRWVWQLGDVEVGAVWRRAWWVRRV